MVWLFGEENAPPDYIMQVITDSGIGATQRAHIDRQMEAMARQGGTRAAMMRFLRNIGVGASAATTLATYAYNNRASAGRENRQEGLGKRKAIKAPEVTQQAKFHRTGEQDTSPVENWLEASQRLPEELPGSEFWEDVAGGIPPANAEEEMEVEDDSFTIGDNAHKANLRFIREFEKESAMEIDSGPGGEEMAARTAGGGGPSGPVSKETPISPYPSLSYGLQETHTTILPYRTYFSFANLTHDAPLQVKLRLNTPFDMFTTTMVTLGASATAAAKGPYIRPLGPGSSSGATATFPVTNVAGAGADERPQWRDFYCRLYDYYTVLGCKYKITIMNTSNVRGGDAEVAVNFDTYSDTAGTAGNIMPAASYVQVKAFKNIRWHMCAAETSENSGNMTPTIISGTYKPGQAHRNIENDGDVKTWTSTNLSSVTLPTLKELLTLNFFKAGLAYAESLQVCGNVCVELDYIVQFKDLKEQARYPNSVTTDQDILINIDDSAADDVRMTQST